MSSGSMKFTTPAPAGQALEARDAAARDPRCHGRGDQESRQGRGAERADEPADAAAAGYSEATARYDAAQCAVYDRARQASLAAPRPGAQSTAPKGTRAR